MSQLDSPYCGTNVIRDGLGRMNDSFSLKVCHFGGSPSSGQDISILSFSSVASSSVTTIDPVVGNHKHFETIPKTAAWPAGNLRPLYLHPVACVASSTT